MHSPNTRGRPKIPPPNLFASGQGLVFGVYARTRLYVCSGVGLSASLGRYLCCLGSKTGGGNLCLMYPKLQSQTMRGEYMGNSMKNSGSWLQSPAEFRAQEEVEIPVQGFSCWFFFFFLCVFGWVFFCKSRAKVDGILGRDSGLPDPASFRLVRTGILW